MNFAAKVSQLIPKVEEVTAYNYETLPPGWAQMTRSDANRTIIQVKPLTPLSKCDSIPSSSICDSIQQAMENVCAIYEHRTSAYIAQWGVDGWEQVVGANNAIE